MNAVELVAADWQQTFSSFVLAFVAFAVLGWVFETTYTSIEQKKFAYRGFLLGPYLPLYGFAALAIILCTQWFTDSPVLVFLVSAAVATAAEYLTSLILEKIFRMRWWTYDEYKFNFQGRIALLPSLFWGLAGLFLVYVLKQPVLGLAAWVFDSAGIWPAVAVAALLLTDTVFTVLRLRDFKAFLKNVRAMSDKLPDVEDYAGFIIHAIRDKFMPSLGRFIGKTLPDSLRDISGAFVPRRRGKKRSRPKVG